MNIKRCVKFTSVHYTVISLKTVVYKKITAQHILHNTFKANKLYPSVKACLVLWLGIITVLGNCNSNFNATYFITVVSKVMTGSSLLTLLVMYA